MANQALFLAGCAELDEFQQHQAQCNTQKDTSRSSRHLMMDAMESYKRFANALERMSAYWDGIRWIYGVLMQRKAGFTVNELIELDVGTDTVVSKRELVSTLLFFWFLLRIIQCDVKAHLYIYSILSSKAHVATSACQ